MTNSKAQMLNKAQNPNDKNKGLRNIKNVLIIDFVLDV